MHAFLSNLANRQTGKRGQTHFSFVGGNKQKRQAVRKVYRVNGAGVCHTAVLAARLQTLLAPGIQRIQQ